MSRLLLIVLLFAPFAALADGSIYRTTDAQGNVVFTDAPDAGSKDAEVVDMHRTNTAPPPEIAVLPAKKPQTEQSQLSSQVVTITSPPTETTIPNGPGDFTVSVSLDSDLDEEQSLQLFMNGEPSGEQQLSTSWHLSGVFRGEHSITVGVIDESGETITLSEPVTVYVYRPSVNAIHARPR